jgi:hypothetical protein
MRTEITNETRPEEKRTNLNDLKAALVAALLHLHKTKS